MKISEIFFSIQAEARGIGEPSVFVRLSGCNVVPLCNFCDTKYAQSEFREIEVENVFEQIKEYDCKNVVITGGEPLLQMGPLTYLVSLLENDGYKITIETNGTIRPNLPLLNTVNQWNISPKFGHFKYDVLKCICDYLDQYIFKFVIENEGQIKEIQIFQDILGIDNNEIYLMPQASNRVAYLVNAEMVVDLCKKYGYNFSPREQIVIWDNKRCV